MKRRDFVKACAATAILVHQQPRLLAAGDPAPEFHHRAQLVGTDGKPIRAAALEPHRNYIFHYPYRATPCFLLDLGRPTDVEVALTTADGGDYVWEGGVGKRRSVVSYAAICAHRMSYPTPVLNFIAYRHDEDGEGDQGIIKCCNEFSVYDPARGAAVLSGPAEQPLTGILLEHDAESDALAAVGVLGGTLFERFFEQYDMQLRIAYDGIDEARAPVADTALVQPLSEFTQNNISC